MNPPGRLQAAVAEALLELTQTLWEMQYAQRRNAQPLTARDFLTLSALREASLHVGDIGKRLRVLPAQMSRIVDRLESGFDEPLISCHIDEEDRRRIKVTLTPAGRRMLDVLRRSKLIPIRKAVNELDDQACRHLLSVIKQVQDRLRGS